MSKREFDVAIGARVVSAEGRKIQVQSLKELFLTLFSKPKGIFYEKISVLVILFGTVRCTKCHNPDFRDHSDTSDRVLRWDALFLLIRKFLVQKISTQKPLTDGVRLNQLLCCGFNR